MNEITVTQEDGSFIVRFPDDDGRTGFWLDPSELNELKEAIEFAQFRWNEFLEDERGDNL